MRERRSDVALLSRHFIEDVCKAAGIPKKVLSLPAMHKLEQHHWPGNIRELFNTIQRAVLVAPGLRITAHEVDLNPSLDSSGDSGQVTFQDFRSAKLDAIESFEREYVKQMLEKHTGNVTQAAREARKDRRAFGRLAKKYGIQSLTA